MQLELSLLNDIWTLLLSGCVRVLFECAWGSEGGGRGGKGAEVGKGSRCSQL